jgi:hypothetical protein
MSPVHAVVGYIVGGCSMLLGVWLVLFAAGMVAQSLAGGPVQYWVVANLLLLGFAAFFWCLVVFSAMFASGIVALVGLLIAGFWLSGGQLLWLMPATGVLAGPLIGPGIFDARLAERINWPLGVSLIAQAALGLIFLSGAARRFRSESQPALGVRGTLLLLLVCCAISAVGLQWREAFAPAWLVPRNDVDEIIAPTVVSMVSLSAAALLTLPVLVAATGAVATWRARRRLADQDLPREPVAPIWPALASVVIVSSLLMLPAVRHGLETMTIARLVAMVGVFVMLMLGTMELLPKPRAPRAMAAAIVLIVWSVVPVAIDVFRHASSEASERLITAISAWSPPGALAILFGIAELSASAVDLPLVSGLLVSILMLAYGARLRQRDNAFPAVAAPATDR